MKNDDAICATNCRTICQHYLLFARRNFQTKDTGWRVAVFHDSVQGAKLPVNAFDGAGEHDTPIQAVVIKLAWMMARPIDSCGSMAWPRAKPRSGRGSVVSLNRTVVKEPVMVAAPGHFGTKET